jgi:hypothetical protein
MMYGKISVRQVGEQKTRRMKHFLSVLIMLLAAIHGSMAQPSSFSPRGVGGGGALFFPRINPANDNEFYISCDMSELFHSSDFGGSYSQIPFTTLQVLNVSTYEWTNNASIAYCNFNDGNDGYPVKTTNGGATWSKLAGYDASLGMVYRMAANYNNPQQLLINYYGDIFFSNDGGITFQLVKHAANMGVGIIMGGAFFDGSNIYIGTNEGIFSSSNGGSSFSAMAISGFKAGQVIWHFSGAKNGGTTRFVCITAAMADTYNGVMPYDYYGFAKGVYTMDNASGTWVSKSGGLDFSNDYVMYTGMAWNDISTIYLAGNDASLSAPLIYKSTDGGSSWAKVFKSANNQNIQTGWSGQGGDKAWSWGETAFGIAVAPNNSSKVLFGDYSFVHTSSDGGTSWKQAYVPANESHPANAATPKKGSYHSIGLENTSCWQVTWQSPSSMISAFSDIGAIRSADSGKSWGYTYNGLSVNSTYRIVKAADGKLFAGTSGIHDMYQSTRLKDAQLDAADANGKIMYSIDSGANWSLLHQFGHPVFWLAIDPNSPGRMYASVIHYGGGTGQGGIWMTDNLGSLSGSTWKKLANPPRTEGHPASMEVLQDGKLLCTFSGRINTSGAFTASSGVFLYDPATSLWSDLSDAGMQYWTKDIVVDPADAAQNTWYACVFSGWGGAPNGKGGLYKTTSRGASWTKLTGTQFDRVTSITFNPVDNKQAFLTTEMQGLWMSSNMNAATPSWSLVTSYIFRQPERVYFNPYKPGEMWVSSFGNGMKVGNMPTSSTGLPVFQITGMLTCYPNPTNGVSTINAPANGQLLLYDVKGVLVATYAVSKGAGTIRLPASLAAGEYFGRYESDGKGDVQTLRIIYRP